MLSRFLVFLIELYQGSIRAVLPSSCRFSPTCSEYAKQAILKYGFLKGGLKAAQRLSRCHPFSRRPYFDPLN